ncbi:Malonyl CoA-acyl carrier protein transacylase (FabD) (PDB:1YXC) [Commensalibacter communis]|uniref:Malonyl CoA-acyl carrier protein transacylase n=1 Tax=Commensalibacter communis TaxID=2972786 RepID=A0A9W4TMK6_9PROT|nr:ACP S-malonyltransferase [Commensalibacter communis]CAI3937948.1 Malonyl CoA-acyl carrier protein transacylase (FabD) (PDB:1YXC) [Commensalibacter communis]CAI3941144.1 Malonyl CoA-acyl carrier protein transacylase (FabD) (PDB:1YXC) [Commensalibacter communis]CAI3942385.1 Malonyl CoA-acyl carrier protein transacylase (FabD) (PDB:1YXC) [Commensalibacter communis]CAI3948689.1 Malonyl CoA-acyl carrier protein transacylase (FabD) (PDB:1YXC) [Commensalibacter communis]
MAVSAFLFPGQGSQYVGMGKELAKAFPVAREVFEELDETLKQPLSKMMMEGPEDELTLTQNTQPALMAHSMAVIRILEKEAGLNLAQNIAFAAGHSLGEYSALCMAGVFDFATTAALLRVRGDAMQNALPKGMGGMAALLGTDMAQAQMICQHSSQPDSLVAVANNNGNGQVVISGHMDAIDRAVTFAAEQGIRRVVKLTVSAPFHSPLMAPAATKMQEELRHSTLKPFNCSVLANVTAQPYTSLPEVQELLVKQVTAPVRWAETMQFMIDKEVEVFFEIGSGKVLSNLMRRTAKDRQVFSIGEPADIDQFVTIFSNSKN